MASIQSRDINPIENLWAIIDEKIPTKKRSNKQEFIKLIKETWDTVGIEMTAKLVDSMPHRLLSCEKC